MAPTRFTPPRPARARPAREPPPEKALLFSAGGVRLALRLGLLREIIEVRPGEGEVLARGEVVPSAFVSAVLGLPLGPARYALVTEATPRTALRVDALHGIVELSSAEAFQLPARTHLPQPPPFSGALVTGGVVALELAVSSIGFAPLEPAWDLAEPPPLLGAGTERELRFTRGELTFAVPMPLLVQVIEAADPAVVPLTPPSHRGLLYSARALHPVLDVGLLYGAPPLTDARTVVLIDAGGAGMGVLADRVLGVEAAADDEVLRPPWDALFLG